MALIVSEQNQVLVRGKIQVVPQARPNLLPETFSLHFFGEAGVAALPKVLVGVV
jgi:hypothetical protein